MDISAIIGARREGATFAEIARVAGKPEKEIRTIIMSYKSLPDGISPKEHMKQQSEPSSWNPPRVHPAAAQLPMMSDKEITELAEDIKKNGLLEPLVIFVDNREEANGAQEPFPEYLLDGRNRWKAAQQFGARDPRTILCHSGNKHGGLRWVYAVKKAGGKWEPDTNPEIFVLSANVQRRHLTSEQKREAIAAFIKADPRASNRAVAKTLGVDDHTVADVRSENAPNAEIPQMEHRPIERAKAILRANPEMSSRELRRAANCGSSTEMTARRELIAEGAILPREIPKALKQSKKREVIKAPEAPKHDKKQDELVKRLKTLWSHCGHTSIGVETITWLLDELHAISSIAGVKTAQETWDVVRKELKLRGPEHDIKIRIPNL